MKNAFITIALLVSTLTASARLGESYEQTVDRYGEPTWAAEDKSWAYFTVDKYKLHIRYRVDTAVSIDYSTAALFARLSKEDVEAILAATALPAGSKWEIIPSVGVDFDTHWNRGDSQARATWYAGTRNLVIIYKAEIAFRKIEADKAAEEAARARQEAANKAAGGL